MEIFESAVNHFMSCGSNVEERLDLLSYWSNRPYADKEIFTVNQHPFRTVVLSCDPQRPYHRAVLIGDVNIESRGHILDDLPYSIAHIVTLNIFSVPTADCMTDR